MTTKQRVLLAIHCRPELANDDALLIAYIWNQDGWDGRKSLYENLSKVTCPESITRARRKLHELGLIEYTKQTDATRYDKYKQMVEKYSKKINNYFRG